MQRITLSFPFRLNPGQLSAFRAEISTIAGFGNVVFHNHLPDADDGSSRWSWDYPKVQYRIRRGKPTVVGIGEGALAILKHVLPNLPSRFLLAGMVYETSGYQIRQDEIEMPVYDTPREFGIAQWIALNKDNYLQWRTAEGDDATRWAILERALRGHLSDMAGLLNPESASVANEARVLHIDKTKKMHWHGTPLLAFHVRASSRILPPSGLGMGRIKAFGFGEVCDPATYVRLLEGALRHQDKEVV